ncbi:Gfo/Idh/MocA family protein [Leptothrix discophora]|uniref:Gfo/Idh/MocA family oxidoreductase n=1 Tax=Leptothrix discophora TaxID=89 RepID=A0ABT9G8T9_LEPDI|nr:Gfo/Idh/MocA family oxidoreductase [Leptothrix discophora]MDP4302717.1 Gfo/Idh/MocA family oxidoreductase [Leptothrix discophora]
MTTTLGIIGTGNIFPAYLRNILRAQRSGKLRLVGVADGDKAAAQRRATEFGLVAMSVDELLDSEAQVILNLTPPLAHHAIGMKVLGAGKHLFSEKPMAATYAQGLELVEAARRAGLRLGCAPDTFLGAGAQTVRSLLDAGTIGPVRHGYGFFMNHGPDHWHPNPAFFYQPGAGPLFDVGVYHLTHLVNHFGPVRSVRAIAHRTHAVRTIPLGERAGQKLPVDVATHVIAHLDFAHGPQIVLTSSFDVWKHGHEPFEFYGDNGTLLGPDPNKFGGNVRWNVQTDDWQRATDKRPYHANARGLGLVDMIRAIAENRPHRCSAEMALHVLEVMESTLKAAEQGGPVTLSTTCERPAPLDQKLF